METALVPGMEDATYASLPNCVAKIAELVDEELVVGSVDSETV